MGNKHFSKKEAIVHGINMTRKHIIFLLKILFVYLLFQFISWQLNFKAGSAVTKEQVRIIYKDTAVADNFYKYLQEAGYISKFGRVQAKLQNITSAGALMLPDNFEPDRERIFRFLNLHRYRLPFPKPLYYLLTFGLMIIGLIMGIGFLKIAISLARDQEPELGELFSNGGLLIKYILGLFCYALVVLGGFILLIIPGIIFMVMFNMYKYLIVDREMGPIESLKASRSLTKGVRWQLFWFGWLILFFNLAGLLCLVVGVLFTLSASSIAMAYVYDKLLNQDEIAVV